MKYRNLALTSVLFIISCNTNAALVSRLDGQAFYDTTTNLTWLADASYTLTNGIDIDGKMTWDQATSWAANLSVGGITDWRLPFTTQPDPGCLFQSSVSSYGPGCSGSELGNMYYNVLGNTGAVPIETGPFSNLLEFQYWSETELIVSGVDNPAFAFNMGSGYQSAPSKGLLLRSWAVRTGDVSAVPVPAAVWLFTSGLLGLIGLARGKSKIKFR